MIWKLVVLMFATLVLTAPSLAAEKDRISEAEDGEWINLSGTAESVSKEGFTLRLFDDRIRVEMDDPANFGQVVLRPGDQVTVAGRVDKRSGEGRSIEASSIHVKNRDEYYYFSAVDEEEVSPPRNAPSPTRGADQIRLSGNVIDIDRASDEITLDTGAREVSIDASSLGDELFDAEHPNGIEVGDRVTVSGAVEEGRPSGRPKMTASSLVRLSPSHK